MEKLTSEMTATLNARVNLMLQNKEVNAIYQAQPTKEAAQDFILHAALCTLLGLTNEA